MVRWLHDLWNGPMVPLIVGIYARKYIFGFHPGILLGAYADARTTTAALGAPQHEAKSSVRALGYTIAYAVGRGELFGEEPEAAD